MPWWLGKLLTVPFGTALWCYGYLCELNHPLKLKQMTIAFSVIIGIQAIRTINLDQGLTVTVWLVTVDAKAICGEIH